MEPFNSLKNTTVHEMNLVKLLNLIKAIDHKTNISDIKEWHCETLQEMRNCPSESQPLLSVSLNCCLLSVLVNFG